MPAKIAPEVEGRIRECLAGGMSLRVAARECGASTSAVQRVLAAMRREGLAESIVAAPGVEPCPFPEWSESGDSATATARTAEHVRTEADAIRVCRVDTSRWKVVGMEIRPYQVAMKLETKEEAASGGRRVVRQQPHVEQLFAVKLKLALIAPRPYLDAVDPLVERLSRAAPAIAAPPPSDAPYVAMMGLFDAHFAKLCWGRETGQDYDLRIAEAVYRNAAEDLLRLAAPYPIGRFLLPVGNDLFHIDSGRNATTNGTVVDTDSRYAKMIEVGEAAVIRLVERLAEVAPVDVLYIPGNHDRLSSYHLCRVLAAWFRRAPGVSVDLSPAVRKYRRHGRCLFGWRHGDALADAQLPTLPGLMAVEAAEDWAASSCREWFLGHRHTSRRWATRDSDETQGVQLRYLSSLSGTDAWHHEQGYIGNRRAAECYLYDPGEGYVGHFVAPARA